MKFVLAVTIICLLEGSLGGIVDSSVDNNVDSSVDSSADSSVDSSMEYYDIEFLCSVVAEKHSSKCAELESDEQQNQCFSHLIVEYIKCIKPDFHHNDVLEDIVPLTIERSSKELGHVKITIEQIKCIVDVILDLIKCIVDGELKPDVPFKWDWKVLINCIMANVTKLLECLPVVV